MDHYIDIRLWPDPETAPALLMNTLVGKLHRVLAALGAPEIGIGVSFPRIGTPAFGLGDALRLHGPGDALKQLMAVGWLEGMRDHVQLQELGVVPPDARFRVVRRVQAKSSAARLRRRQMRRHGYDEAEALRRVPDNTEQRLDLPYVSLHSASTGQAFRLFIDHGPLGDTPRRGSFSAYGLSDEGTIPWF